MKRNGMMNKRILGVSERIDIFSTMEKKILEICPNCLFDKATNLQKARRLMMLFEYNLIFFDKTNLKELNPSRTSMIQNFPIVILANNGSLSLDNEKSSTSNIYGYLPKNRLETTSQMVANLLNLEFVPRWKIPFKRHGGIFNLGTVEAVEKLRHE